MCQNNLSLTNTDNIGHYGMLYFWLSNKWLNIIPFCPKYLTTPLKSRNMFLSQSDRSVPIKGKLAVDFKVCPICIHYEQWRQQKKGNKPKVWILKWVDQIWGLGIIAKDIHWTSVHNFIRFWTKLPTVVSMSDIQNLGKNVWKLYLLKNDQ